MDDRRFDSLAKSLASGASRRTVLKGILGLGGAALAGGALLEGDTDAARRPTNPTPTPVKCPGQQVVCGNTCCCPAGLSKCGPDCCNSSVPVGPGYSECCDQACCFYPNDCVGEELCCPRLPDVGCLDAQGRCCTTLCEETPGFPVCCPVDDFCPGGSESADLCCTGNTTCCGRGTNGNACVDLTVEGNCCTESDCEDPFCEVCNLRTHTCGPRCNPETQVCCTDQAGPGVCQNGTCCPAEPCPVAGQLCCVNAAGVSACVTTGECCEVDTDCDNGCLSCVEGACIPQCTRQECCTVAENRADWFCVEEGQCCVSSDCSPATPPGCEVECDSENHVCRALICLEGQICCRDDAGFGTCTEGQCCTSEDCDNPPDLCSEGVCGPAHNCRYIGCGDGQKCCGPTSDLCVPVEALCCTPPPDDVTPAVLVDVVLCPPCMTCNGLGYCVPIEDGTTCAGFPDDDDDDDTGICCSGQCIANANCCDAGDCDGGEICCADVNICGPSCNGGLCCPGGFCDNTGACCLPPKVGCNGGVCCDGSCDGNGDCCPAGNFHCNGGVCCNVACDREGDCPNSCESRDDCDECQVCQNGLCEPCESVGNICCNGACVDEEDSFSCGDGCCPIEQACCDVDGCCSGACYGGDGDHDFCCDGVTEVYCKPATGPGQCCPDPVNQKCCGTVGCCTNSQCNEEANVCCPSDSFACGTGEGNQCCGTETEKCCDGVCIDASQCCPSTDGNCGPPCDEQCLYRCGTLATGCVCGTCPEPQFCNDSGWCDCALGQVCSGNDDCCSTNCCNGTCIADGEICVSCAPTCDCSDAEGNPINDGLACNGGGGPVCGCGYCIFPIPGCPCGCDGDEECIRCSNPDDGVCELYNQLGICNGGDGFCNGAYCYDCLGLTGACSVDTQCCSGLCDQGACVTCKQSQGTCASSGDCCSPNICMNGHCGVQ